MFENLFAKKPTKRSSSEIFDAFTGELEQLAADELVKAERAEAMEAKFRAEKEAAIKEHGIAGQASKNIYSMLTGKPV